jgi:vacuolar-type H+-ATPase subunit C/Vma6
VSRGWGDLVTRARGLSTHLLGRSRLIELARMRDLGRVAAALEEAYGPGMGTTPGASAEDLELAVRRAAARDLHTLANWTGSRETYLAPLFLDEDRRSIRAVLRGAAAGSPPPQRLAGLIPTPTLPEGLLEELARQRSVSSAVALLIAWGHPFGSLLLEEARRSQPDLLHLDLALTRAYAGCSARAVQRAPRGDATRSHLGTYVRATIDLENASTAIQLATQRSDIDAASLFLSDGRWLDHATFLAAAHANDAVVASDMIGRAFRGTPLARIGTGVPRSAFEDAALSAELRWIASAARLMPLGVAPVIAFFLRLRAQVRDLRFVIWRIALGAPPAAPDALLTVA